MVWKAYDVGALGLMDQMRQQLSVRKLTVRQTSSVGDTILQYLNRLDYWYFLFYLHSHSITPPQQKFAAPVSWK